MGGSEVTARGNGIRQTSGQWRRGNRAGMAGLGPAWGSGSGLAKEAKEAEAGIVKVPGGTRVKTLNPWGRS